MSVGCSLKLPFRRRSRSLCARYDHISMTASVLVAIIVSGSKREPTNHNKSFLIKIPLPSSPPPLATNSLHYPYIQARLVRFEGQFLRASEEFEVPFRAGGLGQTDHFRESARSPSRKARKDNLDDGSHAAVVCCCWDRDNEIKINFVG